MYIDRNEIQEYPFIGSFFKQVIDDSLPADEREAIEALVLETPCDIQEAQKTDSGGVLTNSFDIYFPFDKKVGINIKRGMTFKSSIYGLEIDGEVISVIPTQMGGCKAYIQDKTG